MFKVSHQLSWYRNLILMLVLLLLVSIGLPAIALADQDAETKQNAHSIQPYLKKVIEQVTEFRLDNGIKFIVLENHEAPIVSFVTYADVGGADEVDGKTGTAHFLEHLAFKGTQKIGTIDYQKEKPLLDLSDRLFDEIKIAKFKGETEKVAQLENKWNKVESEANQYVKPNEFGQIVETAGGVGLNAATSVDSTVYFYSFPANKLELWMSLESERFLEPVFREFYREKQVILEERRLRTDNSPIGKTIEAFLNVAFDRHPYKRPVIGSDQDIRNLERKDITAFFQTYYVPSNLTFAVVGDVDPQQVKQLATVYFDREASNSLHSAQSHPPRMTVVEPKQTKTKELTVKLPSQPWYLEGYHCPELKHPDYPIYEVMTALLSNGRTSRLYRSLVEEKQVALSAQGMAGFPGDKYPNLFLIYALTAPDRSVDQVAAAFSEEIQRLQNEPVSESDLDRVKTQLKASVLRTLDSNLGMAKLLTEYEVKTGSWRNIFRELDAIASVSATDLQRVARATFTPENRTIGRLLNSESYTN